MARAGGHLLPGERPATVIASGTMSSRPATRFRRHWNRARAHVAIVSDKVAEVVEGVSEQGLHTGYSCSLA